MKFLKSILFIILFAGKFVYAIGDNPIDIPSDTIALEEVEIIANKLVHFTAGAKIQKIKSTELNNYQSENLSSLLSEITGISIKSYGIVGLSNTSL